MDFSRYTEGMMGKTLSIDTIDRIGNAPALDFVNTVHSHLETQSHDYLRSYGDLLKWARAGDLLSVAEARRLAGTATDHPRRAGRTLRQAVELRGLLHRLFLAVIRDQRPSADDMNSFNRWVADMFGHRRIDRSGAGFDWGWQSGDGALEQPLWPVVLSATELLMAADRRRIKECPAPDGCGWLFLDRSKNGTRRWCTMRACGNISKARRHYRRRSGRPEPT